MFVRNLSGKRVNGRKCLSDEEKMWPVAEGINLVIDNCRRFGEAHVNGTEF